tara:strand:- start:501 stop:692 length:192 start_codon:yes stop_codon:yes gene_type:complete
MLIGGVTILALPRNIPIYVDSKVMEEKEIVLGGGTRSGKIIMSPRDITKLENVQIVEGLSKSH